MKAGTVNMFFLLYKLILYKAYKGLCNQPCAKSSYLYVCFSKKKSRYSNHRGIWVVDAIGGSVVFVQKPSGYNRGVLTSPCGALVY